MKSLFTISIVLLICSIALTKPVIVDARPVIFEIDIPTVWSANESVPISVVTDDPKGVASVIVNYGIEDYSQYSFPLIPHENDTWIGTIPALNHEGTVQWKITVHSGQSWDIIAEEYAQTTLTSPEKPGTSWALVFMVIVLGLFFVMIEIFSRPGLLTRKHDTIEMDDEETIPEEERK